MHVRRRKNPVLDLKGTYLRYVGHFILDLFRPSSGLPIAILLLILPTLSLAIWIPLDLRRGGQLGLSSATIGGNLTQIQAKVIDVMSTAILAPTIVFCFNWYWFSVARVTVNNERTTNSVPLVTLIEASKIETGSYNPKKFLKLVSKDNPRSFLLGFLVLLSAATLSAFQNIIAYEAYTTHTGASVAKLYPLNNFERVSTMDSIPIYSFDGTNFTTYVQNDYNYTQKQQSEFVPRVNEVLTRIAFENTLDKLDRGNYVGINATQVSMNALPPEFVNLFDVPGYRLGIGCQARPPDNISITTAGTYNVAIEAKLKNSGSEDLMFWAEYPGRMDVYTNANTTRFAFAGFPINQTEAFQVYLGRLVDLPRSLDPMPSPYGDVTYNTYNMEAFGFKGRKARMSGLGMICNMTGQTGLHNLSRRADLSWQLQSSTWSDSHEITSIMVRDWQKVLNFQTPTTNMPGWAPSLLSSAVRCPVPLLSDGQCATNKTIDYQVYAMNFLYAAGETERIIYDIKNVPSMPNDTGSSFRVQATQRVLRYRMTYVPLILLSGILSVFFAASISLSLIISSRRTVSYRIWRDVDTLRLLVDSVNGLRFDPMLKDLHDLSNQEMEQRAEPYRVKYLENLKESKPVIRLLGSEGTELTHVTAHW